VIPELLLRAGMLYRQWSGWLQRHPRWRKTIAGGILGLLLLTITLALWNQWEALAAYTIAMEWRWLALAAALYPLSMAIQMGVWHDMMAQMGGYRSLRGNLEAYNLVNLARSLPGIAFHVAGRVAVYERRNVPPKSVLRAVALEAALHPTVGLLCLGGVVLVRADLPLLLQGILFLLLVTVTFLGGRCFARQQGIHAAALARWALLYGLTWVNGLFFLWAILQAGVARVPLGLLDIWYFWLLGSMVSYLATYLLGGLSILREFTLTTLLAGSISLPLAVVVVIWSRVIGLASEAGWSIILLAMLRGWFPNWRAPVLPERESSQPGPEAGQAPEGADVASGEPFRLSPRER
jgi:hypothetical protein